MRGCTTCGGPLGPDAWTNVVCSEACLDRFAEALAPPATAVARLAEA